MSTSPTVLFVQVADEIVGRRDTERVADLRRRVRAAMEEPPVEWQCPPAIDTQFMEEPLAVRKARAIATKLAAMPVELWAGQLFAGSMTLESPRLHAEWGFPEYTTPDERAAAAEKGLSTGCFGHIVPDYPRLLAKGLRGIMEDAERERARRRDAARDGVSRFGRGRLRRRDDLCRPARRRMRACRSGRRG